MTYLLLIFWAEEATALCIHKLSYGFVLLPANHFQKLHNFKRLFCCQKAIYVATLMWKLISIPFCLNCLHSSQFGTFKLIVAAIPYENTLICGNS